MRYLFLLLIMFTSISYSQIKTIVKKEHIKITIKTMLNRNYDPYNDYDLINVGAYDIRVKLYLTKRISLIDRTIITGLDSKQYYYSVGLVYKF